MSLLAMKKKLGEFKKKRVGVKFTETWEDGELITDCKEKLVIILFSEP